MLLLLCIPCWIYRKRNNLVLIRRTHEGMFYQDIAFKYHREVYIRGSSLGAAFGFCQTPACSLVTHSFWRSPLAQAVGKLAGTMRNRAFSQLGCWGVFWGTCSLSHDTTRRAETDFSRSLSPVYCCHRQLRPVLLYINLSILCLKVVGLFFSSAACFLRLLPFDFLSLYLCQSRQLWSQQTNALKYRVQSRKTVRNSSLELNHLWPSLKQSLPSCAPASSPADLEFIRLRVFDCCLPPAVLFLHPLQLQSGSETSSWWLIFLLSVLHNSVTPVAYLFNGLTPSEIHILSLLFFCPQMALCSVLPGVFSAHHLYTPDLSQVSFSSPGPSCSLPLCYS